MSTPAPPPPPSRLTPLRLLGAVAFAVVGFVMVWQGFGLAGFGTDAHALRVLAAVATLFACGLVLMWPGAKLPLRATAVVLGMGAAGAAWWLVPSSLDLMRRGTALRDAVSGQEWYREIFAKPAVEFLEEHGTGPRPVNRLHEQYPSLTHALPAEFERWVTSGVDELVSRYRRLPLDDYEGAEALRNLAMAFTTFYPASADRLDAARQQWLSNAVYAKTHELTVLKPGDWAGFDATAPGRRALADALPDTRDKLLRAEVEWVDSSVESIVANAFTPKPGEPLSKRELWKQTHGDILALKSLDAGDSRLKTARARLFKVAHDEAKSEAAAHLAASNYDLAFGTVRTHGVVWSATATMLGRDEQKALTDLRKTYEFLSAFAAKSAKPSPSPEPAPPPRTKP